MKNVFLLFILLSVGINMSAQTTNNHLLDSVVYRTALSNTYRIEYLSNGSISLYNTSNASDDELINESPKSYEVVDNEYDEVKKLAQVYLSPYLRELSPINGYDQLGMLFYVNLKGELIFTSFGYPSYIQIPLDAIAEFDNAIRKYVKVKIQKKHNHLGVVKAIIRVGLLPLKRLQNYTPPPPPPNYNEPSWNGDMAVRLERFAPTAKKFLYLNNKRIYPDMFNYTDNAGTTEANIYISGIGKASLQLTFYNQSNETLKIKPASFFCELEKEGTMIRPKIAQIYTLVNGQVISVANLNTVCNIGSGKSCTFEFVFDDILKGSQLKFKPYDCKLYLYYGFPGFDAPSCFQYIIDERYEWKTNDFVEATWYNKGYIMLRYMYNTAQQEKYYNHTTGDYTAN